MILGVVSVNMNFCSTFTFSFIFKILGCFSYIYIISSILSVWALYSMFGAKCSISRISTALMKKLFSFAATSSFFEVVSFSTITIFLFETFCLFENNGYIFPEFCIYQIYSCPNCYSTFFFSFASKLTQKLCCFLYLILFDSVGVLLYRFFNFDLCMKAFDKTLFMNVWLFPLTTHCLVGA